VEARGAEARARQAAAAAAEEDVVRLEQALREAKARPRTLSHQCCEVLSGVAHPGPDCTCYCYSTCC